MKNKEILYQKVSDSLKKDIIGGKYSLDSYIPTEIELENMYDVSKITVRKAIQILCNEGYLAKKSGKGTRVISNRPFNILSKASSFTTILEKNGIPVKKAILSIIESDKYLEKNFEYERVIEITRLFEINNEPAILFKHYISVPKETNLDSIKNNNQNFSLYAFMASLGIQISYISDEFSAVEADEEIKQKLSLSKEFVLKRMRESHNKTNQLVEYTEAYYDSSKQKYVIDYEV